MASRLVLRKLIINAWQQSIATDYAMQRINSERSLQASVWANLNSALPENARRMFIEPRMSVIGPDRKTCFPDIVICNTREVIGIVELKYQPRVKPSWRKDISTFHWIMENKDRITISNSRFRGIGMDVRSYPLSKTVLYVWAGVHAACDLDLRPYVQPQLSGCFMALHAETAHSKGATIRVLA